MQLRSLLALVTFAILGSTKCYEDNFTDTLEKWGSFRSKAYEDAKEICGKGLAVDYEGNQEKHVCFSVNNEEESYVFQVARIKDVARTLSVSECYDGIQKEIHGYESRGSSSYTN
ncbi:hypothetical protein F4821DRAFT_253404 [Hypoxylon rubiginosum]|uniref:Uncharacterized protein n=1 Tax=Hypoxylon rubiginosum TaxID=110542 RepID=A0ACC0DKW9_9PEZI|nr:hypothetical protein F4821DRAFT_253404 [Hypoxylon rubiginosum]